MTSNTVSAAELFISNLFAYPELEPLLNQIPEVFIEQARQGATSFYLDNTLLSRSGYQYEDGSCDKVRVVLEDPFLYENGSVAVRFRLSAIMNNNGELTPLRSGGTTTPTQKWVRGFRSNPVVFNDISVQAGVITAEDLELLRDYAVQWRETCVDYGENAPYTKEHSGNRLWLTPQSAEGLITFEMQVRQNPNDKKYTVGLSNVAWSDCKFIGKNTATTQAAAKATGVGFTKPSVNIPKVDRGASAGASTGTVSTTSRRRAR